MNANLLDCGDHCKICNVIWNSHIVCLNIYNFCQLYLKAEKKIFKNGITAHYQPNISVSLFILLVLSTDSNSASA